MAPSGTEKLMADALAKIVELRDRVAFLEGQLSVAKARGFNVETGTSTLESAIASTLAKARRGQAAPGAVKPGESIVEAAVRRARGGRS